MKIFLLIIILALLSWKGFYAWRRGRNTYVKERQQYESLWEYLVANGATPAQARRPLMRQWRFWIVIAVLTLLAIVL